MYSEVEQAALAWAERQIAACEVTDQDYHKAVEVLGKRLCFPVTPCSLTCDRLMEHSVFDQELVDE